MSTPIHPRARAAQLCNSPKVAARETGLTQAEVRAIRDLRTKRMERRWFTDPLLLAAKNRAHRTASKLAEYAAAAAKREAEITRIAAREQREKEVRETLLRAARVARAMGYKLRSSKSRAERISSYYIELPNGPALRISDHEIPENEKRAFMAREHGRDFFTGYHGPEIIIDQARRTEWLRRAIILAVHGR